MENKLGKNISRQIDTPERKNKPPWIFKIQISPVEYTLLNTKFKFSDPKKTSYVYFDTSKSSKEAILFNKQIRLRVKIKKGKYFLELKNRGNDKSELFEPLSDQEFQLMIAGTLPEGIIKNKLVELGVIIPLQPIDTANTLRQKIAFRDGELFLDQTTTNNKPEIDYQAEFRSEKPFSQEEVNRLIAEELKISNTPVSKTKLQKLWENR